MCRIYVNFHITLSLVVSVLTGEYWKSAGENKVNKSYFSNQ